MKILKWTDWFKVENISMRDFVEENLRLYLRCCHTSEREEACAAELSDEAILSLESLRSFKLVVVFHTS